jgi:replication initiation and membrane attachment protein DnaB
MKSDIEKTEYKGGVRTDEGKAISRYNAISHGLLVESVTEYEKVDYEAIYNELRADFKPRNILEELILERIAVAYIKLFRVTKAETEFMQSCLNPSVELELIKPMLVKQGYESQIVSNEVEKLTSIYGRYETSVENRLYKAINKLVELKKMTI